MATTALLTGDTFGHSSTRYYINGTRTSGVVEFKYTPSEEAELVYANEDNGEPYGVGVGNRTYEGSLQVTKALLDKLRTDLGLTDLRGTYVEITEESRSSTGLTIDKVDIRINSDPGGSADGENQKVYDLDILVVRVQKNV